LHDASDHLEHDSLACAMLAGLMARYPASVQMTPSALGLGGRPDATEAFLTAMQMLSDLGLVAYEAQHARGRPEPVFVDATITRRGREVLQGLMRSHEAA
jgi:hypothetical protein